jgi:hypothetical protein
MLLERIERHMQAKKMAPTRFGRDAVGDPQFVFQLRQGREPRARTVQRVLDYLDLFQSQEISDEASPRP